MPAPTNPVDVTEISVDNVRKIILDSMYNEEDNPGLNEENIPANAVQSTGVMNTLVFDPVRLETHREEVRKMLSMLSDAFMVGKGGGWSLMNMVADKDDHLWGEQRDADNLFQLGQALGMCKYCLPRNLWSSLPGGMPYISIDLDGTREPAKESNNAATDA